MPGSLPAVGTPAPDFTLASQTGETISLSDFKGRQAVVLYFFPRADTPGCTIEACGFRDALAVFQDVDVAILGVSPDTVKKQAKFAEKYRLPFLLLADEDHAVAEAYGVWQEKSFMGRKFMGVDRTTFVIDKEGIVRRVFRKVRVNGHAEEALDAVKALE